MKDKDDILIQQFLGEHKPVVEDMGFTRRVMRHLPRRANRRNRLWSIFCLIVGVVVVAATNSITAFVQTVSGVWVDMIGAAAIRGAVNAPAFIAVVMVMIAAGVMITSSSAAYHRR